jgi:ubiquinone/menaquinone biosynthesis C-methylase UbiE
MPTSSQDTWSASEYNSVASFVYSEKNTAPVMSLLQPKGQDKIIDFGCGSGELDLELANMVQLVVGLDSSQSMVRYPTISFSNY